MDILTSIDAVLAEQERCGCGCRVRITARSPSPFFASQECQERWMAGQGQPLPADPDSPPAVEARPAPDPRARREPVVEQARPGQRVVLFIGGPWHGDLRSVPEPLWDTVHVARTRSLQVDFVANLFGVPVELLDRALDSVLYTRQRMVASWWGVQAPFDVYVAGRVTDRETHEALEFAERGGWRP